ncbi:MAG: MoxR family ATPase [Acetatifactor sp.]|nr:MoxR family ATPase [Acetatifactor sp.]
MGRRAELELLIENIEKVIIGKRETIELVITALLSGGHVLLEDVPGVGKTQLAAALSKSCDGIFNRLQLTPDVMPSDITGFTMISGEDRHQEFKKGAAFCNFLLADEINRASAKSQSALLEIMEEKQISVDGTTYSLPRPFMVLATQNPVETYGTYHLPEAQMDRFLMKLTVGYPGKENELSILRRPKDVTPGSLTPVLSCEQLQEMIEEVNKVRCSEKLEEYIVDISEYSRKMNGVRLGVSPRGSLALFNASKAYAYLQGREYVLPDDIKTLAPSVLAHRLMLAPGGKAEYNTPENVIRAILEKIPVPTEG